MGILGFHDIPPVWARWLQTFPVKQTVNHVTHGVSVCDERSQRALHQTAVPRKTKAPALQRGEQGFLVNLLRRTAVEVRC